MRKYVCAAVCILVSFHAMGQESPFLIQVASQGDGVDRDRGAAGGLQVPTLSQAIAEAREHRKASPAPIIILLPEGTIRLDKPIKLGTADSGTDGAPLIIRGAESGTSLVGAFPLLIAPATSRDLSRFASNVPVAPDGLFVAPLPPNGDGTPATIVRRGAYAGIARSGLELFQGDIRLRPARWPKRGFNSELRTSAGANQTLDVDVGADRFSAWAKEPNLWFGGFWTADYAYESAPMLKADEARGKLVFSGLKAPGRVRPAFQFFAFNVLGELTEPGEYVVDRDGGTAIIKPQSDEAPIERARSDSIVVIDGAQHIVFEKVSFEKTLGDAVTVRNSRDIRFEDCFIGHTGGRGISISGGERVALKRCVVADTSETGIGVSGGDFATMAPAGHLISDSVIALFGVDSLTYRPGIEMRGVGIRASGNLIENGAHSGLIFAGNDNVIENNEFGGLVKTSDDAGAIYAGRNWVERGNVIRGNYFHDLGFERSEKSFVSGVYLDDQFCGATIDRNVFLRVSRPVVIGGGRDNVVNDNLFLFSTHPAVYVDDRGRTWQGKDSDAGKTLWQRYDAALRASNAYAEHYPEIDKLRSDETGAPVGNVIARNIAIGSKMIDATSGALPFLNDQGSRAIEMSPPDRRRLADASGSEMVQWLRNERRDIGSEVEIADRDRALRGLLFRFKSDAVLSSNRPFD